MKSTSLDLLYNARATFTAVKNLFRKNTGFSSVKCNDELFFIETRHGVWFSPFNEKVKIKVVATSSQSCKVVIESSSRSVVNLLNFGANKRNISTLSDYINNEVYKLMLPDEVKMLTDQCENHQQIRIVQPDIKMK